MTTIWQNEDGTWEDGCGCKWQRAGEQFVVVERHPKCQKPHPTATQSAVQNEKEK